MKDGLVNPFSGNDVREEVIELLEDGDYATSDQQVEKVTGHVLDCLKDLDDLATERSNMIYRLFDTYPDELLPA